MKLPKITINNVAIACALMSVSMYVGHQIGLKSSADEVDTLRLTNSALNREIDILGKAVRTAEMEFCIRDYRNELNIDGDSVKPAAFCINEVF